MSGGSTDGGCGCRAASTHDTEGALALIGLGAALLGRRRSKRFKRA